MIFHLIYQVIFFIRWDMVTFVKRLNIVKKKGRFFVGGGNIWAYAKYFGPLNQD